jgi:cell division protein FtsI (penicillin-binding protein 3)
VVNKPTKGQYYGGSVAAPVFLEIAEKVYATNLEMRQRDTLSDIDVKPANIFSKAKVVTFLYSALGISDVNVDTESENDFVRIMQYGDSIASSKPKFNGGRTPDLRGMTAPDAIVLLESMGIKPEISGRGRVSRQIPAAGTPIRSGMKVKLILKQ